MRYPSALGFPTGKSKPSANLVRASLGSASAAAAIKPNMTRKTDFLRMEHGFKRDPDTWQDFLPKKSKISVIFGERDTVAIFHGTPIFTERSADIR
jgi:hypothetical protein